MITFTLTVFYTYRKYFNLHCKMVLVEAGNICTLSTDPVFTFFTETDKNEKSHI